MRIVIENHIVRRNILLKAKRLMEREDTKKVFIASDLTRAQQGIDKKLRDKLTELRAAGTGTTKFRISKGGILRFEGTEKTVVHRMDD